MYLIVLKNYPYLYSIFENHNNSNIALDGIMRARFVAANKNMEGFKYLFLLLLSLDFMLVIDNLNTTIQDPKKFCKYLSRNY